MGTLLVYVGVLALVACLPLTLDLCLAYHSRNKTRKQLLDEAARNGLGTAELQEFIKETDKSPLGMSGLARATMALTVIVILGVAMIHILVKGGQPQGSQVVNNVLSMLAGLLAAITGFYYGGRTAEKKAEDGKAEPARVAQGSGSSPDKNQLAKSATAYQSQAPEAGKAP